MDDSLHDHKALCQNVFTKLRAEGLDPAPQPLGHGGYHKCSDCGRAWEASEGQARPLIN